MWISMKKHFEVRSLEWFNSIYLFSWGTYVSLHPGMFNDPKKAEIFRGLLAMWPQETWGYIATIVSMIRIVALFINGQWGLTPGIRAVTAFLSVGAWFCICVGVLNTGWNTGVAIYPGLLLADVFSAFRAASDAAESRATKKISEQLAARGFGDADNVTILARRN